MVLWVKNPTAATRIAAEAGIWCCHSCGIGCSWAWIQSLAPELTSDEGVPIKNEKSVSANLSACFAGNRENTLARCKHVVASRGNLRGSLYPRANYCSLLPALLKNVLLGSVAIFHYLFIYFFCLDHWHVEVLGHGSNPPHSGNRSHCSDNDGSLIPCATVGTLLFLFFKHLSSG